MDDDSSKTPRERRDDSRASFDSFEIESGDEDLTSMSERTPRSSRRTSSVAPGSSRTGSPLPRGLTRVRQFRDDDMDSAVHSMFSTPSQTGRRPATSILDSELDPNQTIDEANLTVDLQDLSSRHGIVRECLLVDKLDRIVGFASKEECYHSAAAGSDAGLHRAVAVAIVDVNRNLLCSLRAGNDDTEPLCGFACSTHDLTTLGAVANDCFTGAVFTARTLITADLWSGKEVPSSFCSHWGRFLYRAQTKHGRVEHQLVHVVLVELSKNTVFNFNEENLQLCWMNKKELDSKYGSNQAKLTPFFRMLYEQKYLDPLLRKDFGGKPNSYTVVDLNAPAGRRGAR